MFNWGEGCHIFVCCMVDLTEKQTTRNGKVDTTTSIARKKHSYSTNNDFAHNRTTVCQEKEREREGGGGVEETGNRGGIAGHIPCQQFDNKCWRYIEFGCTHKVQVVSSDVDEMNAFNILWWWMGRKKTVTVR